MAVTFPLGLSVANTSSILWQMVKGYILIKLIPGFETSALSQMRFTAGVIDVHPVFGRWDVVAVGEASSLFELSRLVINQIRGIQGVQDTETLVQTEI